MAQGWDFSAAAFGLVIMASDSSATGRSYGTLCHLLIRLCIQHQTWNKETRVEEKDDQ